MVSSLIANRAITKSSTCPCAPWRDQGQGGRLRAFRWPTHRRRCADCHCSNGNRSLASHGWCCGPRSSQHAILKCLFAHPCPPFRATRVAAIDLPVDAAPAIWWSALGRSLGAVDHSGSIAPVRHSQSDRLAACAENRGCQQDCELSEGRAAPTAGWRRRQMWAAACW